MIYRGFPLVEIFVADEPKNISFFPLQVLQLTQSAVKVEQGQQQWAGEAAQQAQAAAQAYGASASYGSSYSSSYGYAQPAAPAPQPPGSIKWVVKYYGPSLVILVIFSGTILLERRRPQENPLAPLSKRKCR